MVAILLGTGFEESEALVPADLLRRAGIEVRLVGVDGPAVTSAHGVTVTADLTLAELDREAVDMLVLLRHIADYVIVDCTSVLTGNVLATAALEVADDVLRVCGCDLKAISYFASYLPLIEDRKFKPEQHIRVLSNTRPYPGGMEYENSLGGVKYRLPYLPIVEEQAATLKLLEPLSGKEAKSYEPVIAAIAVEVFGDGK